jgi:hypothetical protein
VAASRAREAVKAVRKRRATGMGSFRTVEEADAATEASRVELQRLGKGKPGGPGNKQTRAAINEANVAHNIFGHPTQDGVEPPHAK